MGDQNNWISLSPDASYDLRDGPYFSWSPTGPWIAALLNTDGKDDIYVVKADNSEAIRLTDDSNTEGTFTWSPDGKYIAFVKNGNIFISNIEEPIQQINLTNDSTNSGSYRTLAWSPDGSQIAYTNSSGTGIYLISTDGSEIKQLTDLACYIDTDFGPVLQPTRDLQE